MFSFLKDHVFAVEAWFRRSLVLTFAVPKEQISRLVPPVLQPDTFNNTWAFIAVAMVQTKNLRPKGFPEMLGNNFFLIGYRVFVRYTDATGKNIRGLYILRSETDKSIMELLGNIFTHYRYDTTDITQTEQAGIIKISSRQSGFSVTVEDQRNETVRLPEGSPFAGWKEARRFAGPSPFTFTCKAAAKEVLIVEGVRENWKPTPVMVKDYHFPFIDTLQLNEVRLASAFMVENIPYYWKKGRTEPWKS